MKSHFLFCLPTFSQEIFYHVFALMPCPFICSKLCSKLFWTPPNYFEHIQIVLERTKLYGHDSNVNLSSKKLSGSKLIGHVQPNLVESKNNLEGQIAELGTSAFFRVINHCFSIVSQIAFFNVSS